MEKPKNHVFAVLGGGCFWCVEAVFSELRGVKSVIPGYAGGHVDAPSYEQVCQKTRGTLKWRGSTSIRQNSLLKTCCGYFSPRMTLPLPDVKAMTLAHNTNPRSFGKTRGKKRPPSALSPNCRLKPFLIRQSSPAYCLPRHFGRQGPTTRIILSNIQSKATV
jgi:Peptide methionine sulfoxide reductase